ncbi:ABC transporter substrate-binding protein [Martelella mediterranea]|uniref:Leucine ABC transporter subunit substrate-binding protein LivK n=1 Tax=Martelella mediterranea DSM 17316 TaxID=1122214 RepID=A0A1U9YWB8_9HYPH|nr:ABC transporter substrate-binding protein [Martelella mediterranea]AQZ49733.1 leucine ABC transporter subunit substrate-binding protein LivK [Martelella mediterranea DSM 17316]
MINRRKFLRSTAATGLMLAAPGLAAPAIAQGKKIKLGYVSPQTGPLAGFAESDNYNIEAFLASSVGKNFEVIVKDSQSNPNRAADVAKELILSDEVNLMLVASTPETTNPVSGVCESEGIPVLSTVAPWQPWFIGQQANPRDPASWQPFEFAFHYFWGMEDIIAVYTAMWDQLQTNKSVGGLFPNDADGNAWGDPETGLKPGLAERGYALTNPGSFQNLSDDFSAQINAFKAANTDIITGVLIPPDFTTFWNQLRQQGMQPKAVTVAKALLFPQSVEALGEAGNNLSSEVWWTPNHPFSSSVTGQSSAELAADFTAKTGRPWTQPIGFVHSLFEVAADVMGRAEDPTDGEVVAEAIAATEMECVVGPIAWNGKGVPPFAAKNVCKTPLTGGQWRIKDDGGYDLVIVENGAAPEIPTGGTMEAL